MSNAYVPGDYHDNEGQSVETGKRAWSAFGQLISQNSDRQVSCQADFGNGEAGYFTAQLFSSGQNVQTVATVEWLNEGNTITRKVSVPGTISGPGQGARVLLQDVTPTVGGFAAAGQQYNVGVSIAPGTRPTTQQPPILYNANSRNVVIPLNIANVPIPIDAGVISVFIMVFGDTSAPSTPFQYTAQAQTAIGNTVTEWDLIEMQGVWVPLPPGSTELVLTNNSTKIMAFDVIWGIDG